MLESLGVTHLVTLGMQVSAYRQLILGTVDAQLQVSCMVLVLVSGVVALRSIRCAVGLKTRIVKPIDTQYVVSRVED